ncbi:transmembrane protein [Legionella sainthelensi]|uniref:Ancillary SecYEG translocon subunit n=1 Tax=Legionella sainthelensi TaxID=28087 RepID=A0A0W0YBW5_9GAMM|nr:tetratricopeptide repeat protein [Legionella sainthelensi]KTD54433.1 transmembrane protein [Legionella sainthelensi]VEH33267.1 transmembrane protein [Legionella sainthelensi]
MSVYMTEEEQLESIKKWWKQYGNLITIVLSLILFGVAGYRYLHWHQDKLTQQASIAYEHMMVALSNHNIKAVRSYANELTHEHSGSVYADVAHMTLAKIYVSKNKLNKAKEELQSVASNSQMLALKQIAKIRIARIYAAEKSYTNALKELSSIDDNTYLPVINELKGDIYGATGQYQEAMNSYKLALDEVKTNGMGNLFLEMKTNEIASKSHSMISGDKKVQSA